MRIYFAAVGSDLWDNYQTASKGVEQNILFSYFDMTEMAGFKFRKRSWDAMTGGEDAKTEE